MTMLWNTLVRGLIVIVCVLVFGGCSKKANQAPAPQEPVKTQAEYKAQADKEITEQNMAQELDKLEQAVDTEANQVP